jgi:Zn-dependent protease with chaperone function
MDIGTIAALQSGIVGVSLLSVALAPSWGVIVPLFAYWAFLSDVSADRNGGIQALSCAVLFDDGVRKIFPRVWQTVDWHARAVGIPRPEILLLGKPGPAACAWASPRPGVGLRFELASLPPNLVSAILAHEMAHIRNKDESVARIVFASFNALSAATWGFVIGSICWLWYGFMFLPLERLSSLAPVIAFALVAAAVMVGLKLFLFVWFPRLLWQHEFAADALGSVITGDPISLVMALTMIEDPPVSRPGMIAADEDGPWEIRTHPPTQDRVAALLRLAIEMRNDKTP